MMRLLLTISAIIEIPTGVALLIVPLLVSSLLLGASLDTPAAVAIARIAGTALVSLGVACVYGRTDVRSRAVGGMVMALLFYNIAVSGILLYLRFAEGMTGAGLLPVAALHTGMALWCMLVARLTLQSSAGDR